MKVVTGGAYWHSSGQGPYRYDNTFGAIWVEDSNAVVDGTGWRAQGTIGTAQFTGNGIFLTIVAYCVPAYQLGQPPFFHLTHRSFVVPNQVRHEVGGRVNCPNRMRPLSGGTVWSPGQPPDSDYKRGNWVTSSMPLLSGSSGWFVAGWGRLPGYELHLYLRCIAVDVRDYKVRSQRFVSDANGVASGSVLCPTNTRIVTGGAQWDSPKAGPVRVARNGLLVASMPTSSPSGWYAQGWRGNNDLGQAPAGMTLTITAMCLPA